MHVQQLFDLTGKTALVTGGGRGIGLALGRGLAEAGADVILASRKLAACQEAASHIESQGGRAWSWLGRGPLRVSANEKRATISQSRNCGARQ